MTQLRKQKDAISNYFDGLLEGIGHRGSSFTDLDAVTHDMRTGRILVQEMKQWGEKLNTGQRRTLQHLCSLPKFTVWVVVKRDDHRIGFADYRRLPEFSVITEDEYRERFGAWWANREYVPARKPEIVVSPTSVIHGPVDRMLTDQDMNW